MYSLEIKPIQVETLENHEQELQKRLINIQLCFADEKFKKIKKRKEVINFLDILQKFTSIYNLVHEFYGDYYFYQQHLNQEINPEKKEFWDVWKNSKESTKKLFEKIEAIYQSGRNGWQEEVSNLIIDTQKSLRISEKVIRENNKRSKVGLFEYELTESARYVLTEYGFSELSEFVQIHFPALYKNPSSSGNLSELKKSLEDLAVIIVDSFPQIEGIVGKSWLMDSVLAERLGFKILEKRKELRKTSIWGQLIDKGGQINKAVLEKFLKTNELPYKDALGIIKVEDFLKRYLPADRRGKIALQKLKAEADIEYENVKKFSQEFKLKFDDLTEDQLESYLRQNKILSDWLETTDGALFLGLLKEAKRTNMNMQEFFKNKKIETENIDKSLKKFIKSKMYKDKEIEI